MKRRTAAAVVLGLGVSVMTRVRHTDLPAHAEEDTGIIIPDDAVLPVPPGSHDSVEDWYIVVLHPDAGDPGDVAMEMAQTYGLIVSHVYRSVFPGFAAKIPPAALEAVLGDLRAAEVEPDIEGCLDGGCRPPMAGPPATTPEPRKHRRRQRRSRRR